MECLKDIATILYGFATAAGVIIAARVAFSTVPNELRKWRTQQVEAKRAEVAAEVLVALSNYIPAIEFLGLAWREAERIDKPSPPDRNAPPPSPDGTKNIA